MIDHDDGGNVNYMWCDWCGDTRPCSSETSIVDGMYRIVLKCSICGRADVGYRPPERDNAPIRALSLEETLFGAGVRVVDPGEALNDLLLPFMGDIPKVEPFECHKCGKMRRGPICPYCHWDDRTPEQRRNANDATI